jgi:hypothetical protein
MKKFKANDLLEMETPGGKVTARVITALDRNCKVATADGAFIVLSYKDLKGMKAKLVTETPADPPAADTGETLADGKVILFRMAGGEILTKTPKGFYLEPADFSFTERVNQAAALRLIRDGEIVIEREATLTTFYVLPAAGPVPTPAAASIAKP